MSLFGAIFSAVVGAISRSNIKSDIERQREANEEEARLKGITHDEQSRNRYINAAENSAVKEVEKRSTTYARENQDRIRSIAGVQAAQEYDDKTDESGE